MQINTASACAFALEGNATVNLTISGENRLYSGSGRAGLEVPSGATLTINGTRNDVLSAYGGDGNSGIGGGAGIGGGVSASGGTIIIKGGNVLGSGYDGGAGIGGGSGGNGGKINISGGNVCGYSDTGGGAGIGGGGSGSCGNIVISGGIVEGQSKTRSGMDIGYGHGGDVSQGSITITGGTVIPGSYVFGGGSDINVSPQARNGNGYPIYLNTLTVGKPPVLSQTYLRLSVIDGAFNTYGVKDVHTAWQYNNGVDDIGGLLYFWLTAKTNGYVEVVTEKNERYGAWFDRGSDNKTEATLEYLGMYSTGSSSSCATGAAGGLALACAAGAVFARRKRRVERVS